MKKLFYTSALMLMMASLPLFSKELPTAIPVTLNPPALDQGASSRLTNRLEEIRAMDKTQMSSAERKALRKEVRAAKKAASSSGGGVYLSLGAIILIIILLIILL